MCHQYRKTSTAAEDRELAPQRGRRIMKGEREAVEQDQFVIDSPTLTTLVEGVERATWEGKVEGAPIMALSGKSAELRRAITSLANALVQAGKVSTLTPTTRPRANTPVRSNLKKAQGMLYELMGHVHYPSQHPPTSSSSLLPEVYQPLATFQYPSER